MEIKPKSIIYARVSSREQESGYSLDSQKKLLNEYAETHRLKVVKVFSVSESANGKKQRETFTEMMSFAVKNDIKHILCEKTDRLTRNFKDAVSVDEWVNSNGERRVHFVKENMILHRDAKSNEKFIWSIKVSVAQYYINNLSEEVKKGLLGKLEAGYLPYQPKFGYKSAKQDGKNIHVIDENEAVFIVRIFDMYSTGNYSINILRKKLFDEGMRTRHGKNMSISRIAAILGDPFYYGALPWKGGIHEQPGKHTPLVSRELYDKVQLILSGKGAPKHSKHTFPFRKLLLCANCGGTMTGELQKGNIYYRCKGYGGCMVKSSIREDDIEKQILASFEIFRKLSDKEREEVRQAVLDLHKEDSQFREKSLAKLTTERQTLESQRDTLYEDRLAQRISIEKWQVKDMDYEFRIKQVEAAIAKQSDEQTKYFKVGSSLVDLAFKAEKLYKALNPEKRRELLKLIFANLKVNGKKVIFSFVKPVEKLVERIKERLQLEFISELKKDVAVPTLNQFPELFYSIVSAQQESNLRPSP